jgi:hypothetical protein
LNTDTEYNRSKSKVWSGQPSDFSESGRPGFQASRFTTVDISSFVRQALTSEPRLAVGDHLSQAAAV